MENIDSLRAMAEAERSVAAGSGGAQSREDQILRYLGALVYEARHGRAKPEEVEQAIVQVDDHVREHGPITTRAEESPS